MIDCTLDSTALVDLTRGYRALAPISMRFRQAAISHVALGEVLFGASKASNPRETDKIAKLLVGLTLLHGDEKTAIIYAQIRYSLERRGEVIPHNDLWIAAASIQADVPLVTRDNHFTRVPGLTIATY